MRLKPAFAALPAIFLVLTFSVAGPAWAQNLTDNPDWKESEVPSPPAFDVGKLVTFEVSRGSSLVYGVDPASVSISRTDSLVRYVMVATSPSGARNVMYEGLRCATGEVKTYARYFEGHWQPVANAQWRSVFDGASSLYALRFARAGACDGSAPQSTVREIVDRLKKPNQYLDQ